MKKIIFILCFSSCVLFGKISNILATPEALNDVLLIDVRTKEEFKSFHVAGSLNVPITTESGYNADFLNELEALNVDKNKKIAVICRSGARSSAAAKLLDKNGYKDVVNLEGGVERLAKEYDYKFIKE
ncbi:rhodanese-like domain-containing protein [Campylobacter ureolyticus]|uniref:rhodanese-like domain-containing protein n=1 Tax=Campylobacter ureolyticus TaxID=827 RepID=UPI0022B41D99|nr:rhodanese-like domain-containing protein [Campylobacter ureolyticus]MCZ6116525.1 rhodanese-like domain-containing protein [Campylobacter ureolyticus]MCZ6173939.1 rhodanese-like domain-containing protein [Campylobacter ureolyticus]MCZ6186505.1 rhodanese-like domain-containing protein [Campylobacter ureolyticus]